MRTLDLLTTPFRVTCRRRWQLDGATRPGPATIRPADWRSRIAGWGSLCLMMLGSTSLARATDVGGTIARNTTWTLAGSPYVVTSHLAVTNDVTLTIEPGVTVQFNNGLGMTILGRLLAEGSPTNRLRFTRLPGATSWSRLDFMANSLESRITFADIEYAAGTGNVRGNGTSLYLEGIFWTNTTVQLLDLNHCSITLLDSVLPSIIDNELIHFYFMPANGHALIKGNIFGGTSGYNDIIDFTGGNRPGPIVQLLDNIFTAGVDDGFDMDGADGHIEGNIFINIHQDASREGSSNPISTGAADGNSSELMICRNIFYDCDHTLLLKDAGSAVMQNNTIVRVRTNSAASELAGVVNFFEPRPGVTPGRAVLLDGNIIWDVTGYTLALNFTNGASEFEMSNSIFPSPGFPGAPGSGNSSNDPMFVNWQTGVTWQNIRSNLALLPGSPAIGSGPNGLDRGALVPAGASISGEPPPTTTNNWAVLTVGGPGIVAYQWRLNNGPWSRVTPLTNSLIYSPSLFDDALPISLTNLSPGTYTIAVAGLNSAGVWQDTNAPTVSKTWTVQPPHLSVAGTLASNTTWTTARPVQVTGDVSVPASIRLTIEAGAIVQLGSNVSINAEAGGAIDVRGTRAHPVRFCSLDGSANWGRLGAAGGGASLTLRHADVEHGQVAVLGGADGHIESCYLHDYYDQPILLSEQAVSVLVRGCRFNNYYETLFRMGGFMVEDSLFENMTGDAVDFDTAAPGSVIRRCTLRHGPLVNVDAVDLGSASTGVLVENCLMYDFPSDKGVSVGENSSNVVVRSCVMYGLTMGVAVKDSSGAVLLNNTIVNSTNGLQLYEKTAGLGSGHAVAWNNIIWNNFASIGLSNGSTITIDYSDIAGAGIYPGISNLNADPLFRNPSLHDYRLSAGSPAIGAGTNGTTLGATFPVGSYLVDTDGDSLPDTWEQTYSLNFNDPTDAMSDLDRDGLNNLQEFWAGTSPADAASDLRLGVAPRPGHTALLLSFQAISNRAYSIEARASLESSDWISLLNVQAATTNRVIQTTDATDDGTARLYRLTVRPL